MRRFTLRKRLAFRLDRFGVCTHHRRTAVLTARLRGRACRHVPARAVGFLHARDQLRLARCLTGADPLAAAALARESLGFAGGSIALRHIGVPYVLGGASLRFRLFRFAMYVYAYSGSSCRTTQPPPVKSATPLRSTSFSPAICSSSTLGRKAIRHEGIYIGRGLIAQAPNAATMSASGARRITMTSYMGAVRRILAQRMLEIGARAERVRNSKYSRLHARNRLRRDAARRG